MEKKKKIMVVDDERDFLAITKINLEEVGPYEVLAVPNAKDIIAQVHAFKPDLIVLDVLMPGVDGMDACKMLNDDALGRNIPVIILSALDKNVDRLKAYKLGIVDYLTKPIEETDLIAKIEKALKYKG